MSKWQEKISEHHQTELNMKRITINIIHFLCTKRGGGEGLIEPPTIGVKLDSLVSPVYGPDYLQVLRSTVYVNKMSSYGPYSTVITLVLLSVQSVITVSLLWC